MKTASTALASTLMIAMIAIAPGIAHASGDPHVPNMSASYCPGGGQGSPIYLGYCDGTPYPDGSYWHTIQYGIPVLGHDNGLLSPGMQCVVGGGLVPQPAPPGGCGGAV